MKKFNQSINDQVEAIDEGNRWLTDRVNSNLHKYKKEVTRHQQNGNLPAQWKSDEHNVVFFTSTEAEWAGIPELSNKRPFATQVEAINWLVNELPDDTKLYVRMHPSRTHETQEIENEINSINSTKINVISSSSPVDSYALVKQSNLVISFGSTIAVEATWLRKTVLTLGPSAYCAFSVGHTVNTKASLKEFLATYRKILEESNLKYGINACKYIYTLKNWEHPKSYDLTKKSISKDYLVPDKFKPNTALKILVRIILVPTNIRKAFLYLKAKEFLWLSYDQKVALFIRFLWKTTP